jgi:hypothetical protein
MMFEHMVDGCFDGSGGHVVVPLSEEIKVYVSLVILPNVPNFV